MVTDGLKINGNALRLEKNGTSTDCQFPDPAVTEAATDDEVFGVAPFLQSQKTPDHGCQFVGELLDRALHHAGGFGLTLYEKLRQLLLTDFFAWCVAERILPKFLKRLAPFVEEFPEGTLARLISDKARRILDLDIITLHLHARQHQGTMLWKLRKFGVVFGHGP